MSRYEDAKGFRLPLARSDIRQYLDEDGLAVGYEEETDSYAVITMDPESPDGYVDLGLRLKFQQYGDLSGGIEKKAKRIAQATVITGGEGKISLAVGGLFLNILKDRTVFCHWPNAAFGSTNHLRAALDGETVSLAPAVIEAFWIWADEHADAEGVRWFMEEHLAD
jgi:hypothetical protein